jgi:hypothetical protein
LGLDPGFGSSPFGLVVTEWVDNQIQIAYAEEFERPDFNQMIKITLGLVTKYGITFDNGCRIFVDGAIPSIIRSLKYQLGENADYEQEIDYYKKSFHDIYNLDFLTRNMFVVPVHFAKQHKRMLAHSKKVLEYNGGSIAITPRFDKLITSLRTADGEGLLDKEATGYDDIFDAFRNVITVLSMIYTMLYTTTSARHMIWSMECGFIVIVYFYNIFSALTKSPRLQDSQWPQ